MKERLKPGAAFRRQQTRLLLAVGGLAAAAGVLALALLPEATSTDAAAQSKPDSAKPAPSRPDAAKPAPAAKPGAAKPEASPPVAPNTLAGAAAAGASAAPANLAAKLVENGAGRCANSVDAEAVPTMVGVTQSNTVSLWSTIEPRDRHAASVFVGQRYGASQAVPYGVTGLIASPAPSGTCDVTVVQVVASPLPCANVRETLIRQGKQLGEVVGMPLIQSGDNQTLLMPTTTNTCVLVGFRTKFGE